MRCPPSLLKRDGAPSFPHDFEDRIRRAAMTAPTLYPWFCWSPMPTFTLVGARKEAGHGVKDGTIMTVFEVIGSLLVISRIHRSEA